MASTMTLLAPQATVQERLSYEDFLHRYTGCHAEWVDGEVIELVGASTKHADLSGWLAAILRYLTEETDSGRVIAAPYQMRLAVRPSGREPDLLFVSRDHLHLLRDTYLDGPADVVIEIVSPDSQERDWQDKFREYETAGIREYWVADPDAPQAAFFRLGPDGR